MTHCTVLYVLRNPGSLYEASEITDDVSESGLGAGVIYEHVKLNGFLQNVHISVSFSCDTEELVSMETAERRRVSYDNTVNSSLLITYDPYYSQVCSFFYSKVKL